jgi:MFS family permease
MLLTTIGGIAIGMGRVVTTFYALELGANNAQIGYIAALEAIGRLLVTVPAGFIIARYGARRVYAISSILPMLFNAIIPWMGVWYGVAVIRGLIGLAIPFRVVAMNSAFLQKLQHMGASRAGWYRGAQSFGMLILGPMLASLMTANTSYLWCYLLIAFFFGVMVACSHLVLPEEESKFSQESAAGQPNMWAQVRELWAISAVRDSCKIEFVNSATASVFTTFIIVLALNIAGLSQAQAVSLLTMQGITVVVSSFGLGFLLNIFPREKVQLLSVALAVIGLTLLGTSLNFILLILGTVSLSIGSALISLTRTLQLSQLSISKSKISGVYNLANMSGSLTGAITGGLFAEWLGLQILFLLWIPIFLMTLWWGSRKRG